QVDYPTIVVSTQLPGASADTMASAVTTPLERQFGQMPSLAQMTSVSSFGSSQITLQFSLDRDIDGAQQDVQAAINAASKLLPRTLPAPPTYSKSNPADQPILTLAVTSTTLSLGEVARPIDGVENSQLAGWANHERAIIVNVQRQPGANIIEVTDKIKALLPALRASMPQAIDIQVMQDRTETVRASVDDVQFT